MSGPDLEYVTAVKKALESCPKGQRVVNERIIWHDDGTRRFVFRCVRESAAEDISAIHPAS